MNPFSVRSFAKVNLGLEVLGTREDGYHELRTLFQTIDLCDEIVVRPGGQDVTVSCDHPEVPCDDRNLALRAALDLRTYAGIKAGLALTVKKHIPVGGGLGGGSSNAAAVLQALDRYYKLGLGVMGLYPLARRLGADVPYFLVGGTALGVSRGDEIYPLRRQIRAHLVVVAPGVAVSTAAVFRRVDQCLTPRENSNTIYRFVASDLDGQASYHLLANDLEQAALQEAPELAQLVVRIRGILLERGARLAALSGSGSSYFGLFDTASEARSAHAALVHAGFAAIRSRTVSLDAYQRPCRSLDAAGTGAGKEPTSWRSQTSKSSR